MNRNLIRDLDNFGMWLYKELNARAVDLKFRRYTQGEEDLLYSLYLLDMPPSAIAFKMGRSEKGIRSKIQKLKGSRLWVSGIQKKKSTGQ